MTTLKIFGVRVPCRKYTQIKMQWHSQFTITIGLIAMLWITSAGVKDDQFEDGSWGRLKETLSHKHMCSWCAGQEDWSAAALNFSQQVFLLLHHSN